MKRLLLRDQPGNSPIWLPVDMDGETRQGLERLIWRHGDLSIYGDFHRTRDVDLIRQGFTRLFLSESPLLLGRDCVAGVLDLDLMLKMWVALVRVRRKIGLIEAPQEYVLWLDAIYRPKERAYLKMIAEVLNSQGFGHNGQFWYNSTVWYVVHYEPDNGGKYLPCNARLAARERLEREPKLTVLRQVLGE